MASVEFNSVEASKWPRTIGVISLIYACGGMLCGVAYSALAFLSEFLMKMGGMEVAVPGAMKVAGAISGAITIILGAIMLSGAVGLLRRRRSGVTWLKRWAVLRLIFLVIGFLITVFTASPQVRLQREILEAQNEQFRKADMESRVKEQTDEQIWRKLMIQTSIFTGLFAIYPVFLGFYLSSARVRDESAQWE